MGENVEVVPFTSEEDWLAARRGKITATRIAKLANGGAAARVAVAKDMDGDSPPFTNQFMEWGKEREPYLIGYLNFVYDIEPSRDLYVCGDYAATPDGITYGMDGELTLAEVKTTVKPLGATPEELRQVNPQYYDQVCWAAGVCGATSTVFAWELHENFVPVRTEHFVIPFDSDRFAELKEIADEFMAWKQDGGRSTEWDEFMAEYAIARRELDTAKERVAALEEELRERAGGKDLKLVTAFGNISLSTPKPTTRFDYTAYRKDHPDLVAPYMKTSGGGKQTLRITLK